MCDRLCVCVCVLAADDAVSVMASGREKCESGLWTLCRPMQSFPQRLKVNTHFFSVFFGQEVTQLSLFSLSSCLFVSFSHSAPVHVTPPVNARCPLRDPHSASLSHLLIVTCGHSILVFITFSTSRRTLCTLCCIKCMWRVQFLSIIKQEAHKPANSEWSANITFNNKTKHSAHPQWKEEDSQLKERFTQKMKRHYLPSLIQMECGLKSHSR